MAERFANADVPGDQAKRLERGELDPQVRHLELYVEATGFPMAWFMEPDLPALFSAPEEAGALRAQIRELQAEQAELVAGQGTLHSELEDLRKHLELVERKAEGRNNAKSV